MAEEVRIRMALIPCLESKQLLHPPEDVRERLISSLKALQVSEATLRLTHGARREAKLTQIYWQTRSLHLIQFSHLSIVLLASLIKHSHAHIEF